MVQKKEKIIEETFSVLENNVKVILIENRGRDVSALLVGTKDFIMDYDYVCFVHDKKVTQLSPQTVGAGFHTNVLKIYCRQRNLFRM